MLAVICFRTGLATDAIVRLIIRIVQSIMGSTHAPQEKTEENFFRERNRMKIRFEHIRLGSYIIESKSINLISDGTVIAYASWEDDVEDFHKMGFQLTDDLASNLTRFKSIFFWPYGRNYITDEDLPILVKIVLSSANRERISVIKALLLAPKGISGLVPSELDTTRDVDLEHLVNTSYLVSRTGISKSQVHRIVTELEILELVDIYKVRSSHQNHITFKEGSNWVYEEPFQNLLRQCYPDPDKQDIVKKRGTNMIQCPGFFRFPEIPDI